MHEKTRLNLRSSSSDSARPKADRMLNLRAQPVQSKKEVIQHSQRKASRRVSATMIAGVSVLVVSLIVSGYFLHRVLDNQSTHSESASMQQEVAGDSTEPTQSLVNDELGLSLDFSKKFVSEPLSDADVRDGFIARLTMQDPPAVVTIRKEDGLRTVATLANIDVLTLLKNNIDKSLPDRYPNFDPYSSASEFVNGKEVIERVFTYVGPSGETAKQRLIAIIKNDNTAVYVTMQTTEALYDSVSNEYFDPLYGSFEIN